MRLRKAADCSAHRPPGATAPDPSVSWRPSDRLSPAGSALNFRRKSLAALLAFLLGALGAHRVYLGQRLWWLPLGVTLLAAPLLIGVRNWYQTPAFFVAVIPFVAGCIEAIMLALTPDAKFDARFNPGTQRTNQSGWGAVLVAIAALMIGAIVLMTTIVLLLQTVFER